jgi:hypothetical protein
VRRLLVLPVILSACAHSPERPIDDPRDDAPLHARVALRCEPDGAKPPVGKVAEGRRLRGGPAVPLRQETLVRLHDHGYNRVTVRARICEDVTGAVSCIDFGDGTRPREVAQTIVDAVQEWKYEPSTLDGVPVATCGTVTFNYKIQ